jgi:hypothetical protein
MSDKDKDISTQVAKSFEAALNRHGYGFQYSVLREAEQLAMQGKSPWGFSVSEFPVEVQGSGTRIDFVLKNYRQCLYMVAECKRANPALSNWCFAKVPESIPNSSRDSVFVEVACVPDVGAWYTATQHRFHSSNVYHIALEVRTRERGDPGGSDRGAIEQAATQVCRGLNGLLNFFKGDPDVFKGERGNDSIIGFLPVIFTTARLWASDVDLSSADLQQGKFDLAGVNLEEKLWLFYHYHQSPGLKHSVDTLKASTSLEKVLYSEYVRTIAVVNAQGISEFLRLNVWLS